MKRIMNTTLLTVAEMILVSIALGQAPTSTPPAPKAAAAQARSTASSDNWPRDPTAFVHLLMGDDLSLHPSVAGKPSVSVPYAVRQQIIGTRVAWTVIRRASPFPSGPRTLPTAAIRQGNQTTGLLLLMCRRVAGDTEVNETPYQSTAIDAPVEISEKIASFQAGVRPDGNIVVVVEVTDASGSQTSATAESGNRDQSARLMTDVPAGNAVAVKALVSLTGRTEAQAKSNDPISGEWDAKLKFRDGSAQITLKLELDGEKVTGQVRQPGDTSPIRDGIWAANRLILNFQNAVGTASMRADLKDDKLIGEISVLALGRNIQGTWEAERKTQAGSSPSSSNDESAASQIDLSGVWSHQRKGGKTKGTAKGTLELSRASDLDKEGYTAFRGVNRYEKEKNAPNTESGKKENFWVVAVKGDKVVICMEGLCAAFPCAGLLTKDEEIIARCRFIGFSTGEDTGEDLGEFRAKRLRNESSPKPNQ